MNSTLTYSAMNNMSSLFHTILLSIILQGSITAQLQLNHTNGPEGASISYVFSDDEFAYFPDPFFLYRTEDGLHWERLPHGGLDLIAGSPFLLAAYRYFGWGPIPQSKQFVISKDHGLTWLERTLPPIQSPEYLSFSICSHGIYTTAYSEKVIYRSVDEGMSWQSIDLPDGAEVTLFDISDRLFVKHLGQMWEMNPDKGTWSAFTPIFPNGKWPLNMINYGNNWMVSTVDSLWVSEDNGASWNMIPDLELGIESKMYWTGKWACIIDQFGNIFCSEDHWKTWKKFTIPESMKVIYQYERVVDSKILILTAFKGILCFDPEAWTVSYSASGLQSAHIYDLEVGANQIWAATGNGIFAYSPVPQQWTFIPTPMPRNRLKKIAFDGIESFAVVSTGSHYILLSQDGGQIWDSLEIVANPWSFGTVDDVLWNKGYLYVFLSDYFAVRFIPINFSMTEVILPKHPCYFQGNYYGVYPDNMPVMAVDLDSTWTEIPTSLPGLYRMYSAGDRLFGLAFENDVPILYTSLDGINWIIANEGLPPILKEEIFNGHYQASTWRIGGQYYIHYFSGGLYQSLDQCQTWQYVGADQTLDMVYQDTSFYFGGNGGGVFRSGLNESSQGLASGIAFIDGNQNGVKDNGELGVRYQRVEVFENGSAYPYWFATTRVDGRYSVGVSTNHGDTIRLNNKWKYIQQIEPKEYVFGASSDTLDFAIQLTPDIIDVSILGNFIGPLRSGFGCGISLSYTNDGTVPVSGEIGVKLDPLFEYSYASPTPKKIIGLDSLVWEYSDLNLFELRRVSIYGKIDQSVPIGSVVHISASISPINVDQDLAQNYLNLQDVIVGSYDPNDKSVHPAMGLTEDEILAGKEVEYTIRFQNTGTHSADRVRIVDQLDATLNLQSIRLIDASHEVTSFDLLPGGLLKITFEQIHLPDSTENELQSHGYVTFAIQLKKVFNPDFKVYNEALIYFDFNDPIITNTVLTELYDPSVSIEFEPSIPADINGVFVYPIPADGTLILNPMNGLTFEADLTYRVYNAVGVPVAEGSIQRGDSAKHLNTSHWAPGSYLVQVRFANGGHEVMPVVVFH